MSSTINAEKYSPKNELEPEEKPTGFGHFFSRIGPARNRNKSHRESFKKDAVALCSTQLVYSIKNGTKGAEGTLNIENDVHLSPPARPKRHSLPFARIIHRLSMSRKSHEERTISGRRNCSDLDHARLNSSHETVYSVSSPSTAYSAGTDVLSRPAVSENDLRFATLFKDQELERSATALSENANGVHSEDNLHAITRIPSYLRLSCTLNGYRRPYRRLEESKKLPMSIVELRTLAFSQQNYSGDQKSVKLEDATNRNNLQMEEVSKESAPVRQLIARFDGTRDSTNEGKVMEAKDCHSDDSSVATSDTDTTAPLKHPVAPQNSIAVSDQLYGAAYTHTNPKPSVAQKMHRAILKTTMESKPHAGNQAEIRIENGHFTNEQQLAEKVRNEDGINFLLPDGEAYRRLLVEARSILQLHSDEAKISLEEEASLPEHAAGALRAAVGQANLLVNKKMAKFDELVQKHLCQDTCSIEQVTLSDLSGYWALISIELKELEDKFKEINLLREHNWEQQTPSISAVGIESHREGMKKVRPCSPAVNGEKMALEAHRRQIALAAAKRRQKELKKGQKQCSDEPGGKATKMVV